MRLIRRFGQLGWNDRLLLAEATASLVAASLAVGVLPFRWAMRGAEKPPRGRAAPLADDAATVDRVRWAVEAGARHLPWRMVCIQKGLAVHRMLRRRGVPTILHYGVARDDAQGLKAHVWVTEGELDIIGGREAAGHVRIASFPAGATP